MSDIQVDWQSSDFLLEQSGNSRDLLLKQAEILIQKKEYDQAWTRLNREVFKFVSNPQHSFLKGKTAFYLGSYADAQRYLEDARELGFTEDELFYLSAAASLKLGDNKAAIESVNTLLALQQKPEFHTLKGQVLLEAGDTVRAEREFQVSIGQDSSIRENYLGLGTLYLSQNKPEKAGQLTDLWLSREPLDRDFLMIKAQMLEKSGSYREAGDLYRLLNNPSDPEFLRLRAENFYKQGKYDSAAILSNQALMLQDEPLARLILARSFEAQRLYSEAENEYKIILERDSTVSEASEAITRLERRSEYLRYLREQEEKASQMTPPEPDRIDLNDSIR
ncbi:tetratricopeptide repeat protein [Fulvivirga sedimenti]|uniref:Tetratricopeptide repeat protein n=1 Tax=Fulvivirga sedimenti TaxID=2879465 RepID=A0A9X1HSU6_9BACT|nr:tetratricopeptide repeat protein [Fulvivirga sedimenti]MCA6074602.1 tetratricopeptide repeat protein [Fulvivirga sedimenti]MCA6075779.1 tetratricopeptide repeat protein [Fulvivirga sedimenti]MCA6076907.1 tetratricopeptide repeat protein [Fulvivirga sedimenti]